MKIGLPTRRQTTEDKLQTARVKTARATPAWVELDPDDLVERGTRLVSVSSDEAFTPARGLIYEPHTARAVADFAPLRFVVGPDNQIAFYELEPRTWSEQLARRRHG